MAPKKKATKPEQKAEKRIHNDPALSKFPPAIRQVMDLLSLVPEYNYVFFFDEINPVGHVRQSGMITSLVPMVEQSDGSVKPMRASIGMMVDFMLSVERQDGPSTKFTQSFEPTGELPRHKM